MKRNMLLLVGFAALALAAAIGCSPAKSATEHVDMFDTYFSPASLTVAKGATVTWVNKGAVTHTSTSGADGVADGNWASGNMAPGDSFQHTFDAAGSFHYFCQYHWMLGMQAMIIVTP